MPSTWDTAKRILSGKPRGSKLIVLGVFMVTFGAALSFYNPGNFAIGAFVVLGIFAFMRGVSLYETEAQSGKQRKAKEGDSP
jgi:uncharacterized membrane protein